MIDPSSLFSLDATTWSSTTLDALFGDKSVITSALYLLNLGVLAIAGLLFIAHSLAAIIRNAHHGKWVGHHGGVWVPVRFVMGMGLVVPLPPLGLTAGQDVVIGLARAGAGLADHVWSEVTEDVGKGLALATPPSPDAAREVLGLWRIASCMAIQNRSAGSSGGATVTLHATTTATADILSADGDEAVGGVPGQCGSILFPLTTEQDGRITITLKPVRQAQQAAAVHALEGMKTAADAWAQYSLPPGGQGAPTYDAHAAVLAYNASVMAAARTAMQAAQTDAGTALSSHLAAWSDQAGADTTGWAGAPAWAFSLGQAQGALQGAVAVTPAISQPKWAWWDGDVYTSERVAMLSAEQWMQKQLGRGAVQTSSSAEEAYLVGQTTDSSWSWLDVSRIREAYDLMGATGGTTTTNPFSTITGAGHMLLDAADGIVVAYVGARAVSGVAGSIKNVPILGAIAGGLDAITEAISPGVWGVVLALLLAGVGLAYVVPALPMFWGLLLVCDWLVRVVVGVIAAPLAAALHLSTEDTVGMGARGDRWWRSLIDVTIRPAGIVLGLVFGYAIFMLMGRLFCQIFYTSVRVITAGHYGGVTGLLAFSELSMVILVALMGGSMAAMTKLGDWVMSLLDMPSAAPASAAIEHHGAGAAAAGGAAVGAAGGAVQQVARQPHRSDKPDGAGGSGDGGAIRRDDDHIPR
ncbi:MAG TPA: DotA/TraY family protein [Candidatus Sulfotelmatobacter sp.]|jgi:conjugal transfer/type IV secretion protein DotA/TraY|nr:DotA/TraY family protein [Candidatus Sulfotelmatobacter sp.]